MASSGRGDAIGSTWASMGVSRKQLFYADADHALTAAMEDWVFGAGGGPSYQGILRRWTGGSWSKGKLLRWDGGAWGAKPLKRWTGAAWVEIDATGV